MEKPKTHSKHKISFIFKVFGLRTVFSASPCKTMQNHYEITSKSLFWTRGVQNLTKSLTSDMSGPPKPVQEEKSLSANRVFPLFFRNYTFPICINKFISFIKSYVLLSKCMILKIQTKEIYGTYL